MVAKFSGLADACFQDYLQDDRTRDERISFITVFIQASSKSSVRTWYDTERLPRGLLLVKLRVYLDFAGYDVVEHGNLPLVVLNLNKLLGYQVVDIETLCKEVMGGNDRHQSDTLAEVLQGRKSLAEKKNQKAIELFRAHKASLQSMIQKFSDAFGVHQECVDASVSNSGHKHNNRSHAENQGQDIFVDSFVSRILTMLPEARYFLSDAVSADTRTKIRDNSNGALFQLANELNRLCSETARRTK